MPGIQSINQNTQRKSIGASLGEVSSTSRVLDNEINVSLYGESEYSQGINYTPITEETFQNIQKVNDQNGNFVSMEDTTNYPINPEIGTEESENSSEGNIENRNKDYNVLKVLGEKVGNLFERAKEYSSKSKDENGIVQKDNEPSVRNNTEMQLEDNTGNYNVQSIKDDKREENERKLWGNQNENISSDRKESSPRTNGEPFVIIEEDRGDNEALKEHGEYSNNDIIRIEVLRAVSPFTFGTRQDFDAIEPRGSQTPLRFYNKNPGRSLGFSADFHQQEYPLEPLLYIAEKAQYLCRPYRHGDYALIPKLVRVTIPGRVFRGYLQSADITYQGDDYRSWSLDKYRPTESGVNNSLPYLEKSNKENRYYEYPIEEHQTNRIRNDTYTEAIDYGLSEISIRFDLLITEEIKLTSYVSDSEKKSLEMAQEEAKKRAKLEEALEKARQFLESHPDYAERMTVDDLIYVDKETGEYLGLRFNEETGEFLAVPEGGETYKNYKNKSKLNSETANKTSGLASVLEPIPEVAKNPVSKQNMLDYLIRQELEMYPEKSLEQIKKEINEKYGNDDTALIKAFQESALKKGDDGTFLSQAQADFLSYNYSMDVIGDSYQMKITMDNNIKSLLVNPIGSDAKDIENTQKAVNELLNFFHDFDRPNVAGLDFMYDLKIEFNYGCYIFKNGIRWWTGFSEKKELWEEIYKLYKDDLNKFALYSGSGGDFHDLYFSLSKLQEFDILGVTEISAMKEVFGNVDKVTVEDIYKKSKTGAGLVIPSSPVNRKILDHVCKTFSYFRDCIYKTFKRLLNNYSNEVAMGFSSDGTPYSKDFKNLIINRGILYKCFPDKSSMENAKKLDDQKKSTPEKIFIVGESTSYINFESYKYNYFYYKTYFDAV